MVMPVSRPAGPKCQCGKPSHPTYTRLANRRVESRCEDCFAWAFRSSGGHVRRVGKRSAWVPTN